MSVGTLAAIHNPSRQRDFLEFGQQPNAEATLGLVTMHAVNQTALIKPPTYSKLDFHTVV